MMRHDPDHFKTQEMCDKAVGKDPRMMGHVPDHVKTQEMCNKAVEKDPLMMRHVPDHFKSQEMCDKAVEEDPCMMGHAPDRFKTQGMCIKAVEKASWVLCHVPDQYKKQEICVKAVGKGPFTLQYVPDWFVTQGQVKSWHDDDELVMQHDSYQKCKAQKAQIKKELMPIAWHPSRWWDWCVPEDEKKETKIMGINIDLLVSGDRIQNFFDPKRSINKDALLVECF